MKHTRAACKPEQIWQPLCRHPPKARVTVRTSLGCLWQQSQRFTVANSTYHVEVAFNSEQAHSERLQADKLCCKRIRKLPVTVQYEPWNASTPMPPFRLWLLIHACFTPFWIENVSLCASSVNCNWPVLRDLCQTHFVQDLSLEWLLD